MGAFQRRLTAVVLLAAVLGGAAGCDSDAGDSAGSGADGVDLLVGAVQHRSDEAAGLMSIVLTNRSDEQLRVEDMHLSWPALEEVDDTALDYPLRPGEQAALKVPYGAAVCTDEAPETDDALAVMTVTGRGSFQLPITDGLVTLTRIYDKDCLQRSLEEAVDLAFSPASTWQLLEIDGAPVLRGDLVVTRKAYEGDVVVDGGQGSVVLVPSMTPPVTSPWVSLPAGTDTESVSVDVRITGRCGGHVLGEVKKPYEFEIFVDAGDGPLAYAVPSEPDLQDRFRDEVFWPGCGV